MSGLEIPLLIASAVGTTANVGGQVAAGYAKANAAERTAQLKNLQADELLARQKINEGIMRVQSEREQTRFVSSFASTGREGAGIGGILQMKDDLEQNITISRRDAEFKAKMLRMGADIDMDLASDSMTAAWISGAGSLLTSGVDMWATLDKYGAPKSKTRELWDAAAPTGPTTKTVEAPIRYHGNRAPT